jgi:hypothetical protein
VAACHLAPNHAILGASHSGLGLVYIGYFFAVVVLASLGILNAFDLKKRSIVISVSTPSVKPLYVKLN